MRKTHVKKITVTVVLMVIGIVIASCGGLFGDIEELRAKGITVQTPLITSHPEWAGYNPNDEAAPLSVSATVTDGGSLSYKWYRNAANSNSGGTPIWDGAEFVPPTNALGINYYYAVVTNTKGSKSASAASAAARITVTEETIVNAQTPSISDLSMQSHIYYRNDTATPLEAGASVTDGGEISYQWYLMEGTSPAPASDTKVGTASTFIPACTIVREFKYYVVVTNYNDIAIGNPVATITSSIVAITVNPHLLDYWTTVEDSINIFGILSTIHCIAYGNGQFFAFGQHETMAYSINGINWTVFQDSLLEEIAGVRKITYGNDIFVAAGNYLTMAYSINGISWTACSNYLILGSTDGIGYGNGIFVAGGVSGSMAYSSDGIIWTAVTDSTFGTSSITDIAYGNGKFVAVGYDGKMAYSSDGMSWTAVTDSTFGTSPIMDIAYGNGKFVAVGYDGKMAYSSDGINWTAVIDNTFGTSGIVRIAYGNGIFVAVAPSGRMAYSSDGISWTAVTDSTFGTSSITDIAYGNGKFVAVGYDSKMAWAEWP